MNILQTLSTDSTHVQTRKNGMSWKWNHHISSPLLPIMYINIMYKNGEQNTGFCSFSLIHDWYVINKQTQTHIDEQGHQGVVTTPTVVGEWSLHHANCGWRVENWQFDGQRLAQSSHVVF